MGLPRTASPDVVRVEQFRYKVESERFPFAFKSRDISLSLPPIGLVSRPLLLPLPVRVSSNYAQVRGTRCCGQAGGLMMNGHPCPDLGLTSGPHGGGGAGAGASGLAQSHLRHLSLECQIFLRTPLLLSAFVATIHHDPNYEVG